MTERESIRLAVGRILWGYLFIYLDINLLLFNILPDWVGYVLIVLALDGIQTVRPTARLLKTPGVILAVWEVCAWLLAFTGEELSGIPLLKAVSLVMSVLELYFHFQLLSDLADTASYFGYEESIGGTLRFLRNVRTVLMTLILLPLPWQENEWASILLLMIQLILIVWTFLVLRSLKRSLADEEDPDTPDEPDEPDTPAE